MGPETKIDEVKSIEDARRLSEIILASLDNDGNVFNPFSGRIFKHPDGSITLSGRHMDLKEATREIARAIWQDKKNVNRAIRKWKIVGTNVVDCGC